MAFTIVKHKQLNKHDPENGVWGDCERTAFACFTGEHPSWVPHWNDGYGVTRDDDEANRIFHEWLDRKMLFTVSIGLYQPDLDFEGAMKFGSSLTQPDIPWILGGESPRGFGHVVIVQNGEMLWDPTSEYHTGLAGPHPADDKGDARWAYIYVGERP